MKKIICSLFGIYFFLGAAMTNAAFAQDDDFVKSTQQDIMLVGGAGAAGAILGLSTLSFVDKPSQHLSNIWTGAALGVIAGVIVVAYNSAQRGSEELQSSRDFNSSERVAWHSANTQNLSIPKTQFSTQVLEISF